MANTFSWSLSKSRTFFLASAFLFLLLLSSISLAQSDLPIGLQKIMEENQRFALDFTSKVTLLMVFLAGVTTILSPCLLPVLPAFFAYAFKERRELTKMTLLFFLGFTPIFVFLGIATTYAASFITLFMKNLNLFIMASGAILVLLGILYFFGLTFALTPLTPTAPKKTAWGILGYGFLFGLGWLLCVGPILSGVLISTTIFHNYFMSSLMMVAYALGVFVPLFLISFFYDQFKLGEKKFMQGYEVSLFSGNLKLHSSNMIAGALLIITGGIFIFFKGTGVINSLQYFGLKAYFYSLQDWFLLHSFLSNVIGGAILLCVLALIVIALRKK